MFLSFFCCFEFFCFKIFDNLDATWWAADRWVVFFFKGLGMFFGGRKIREHKIYDHQMSINRISIVEKICFRVKRFRVLGEHFSWQKKGGAHDNFT